MIYLVRHGQTNWNAVRRLQGHTDVPLNDIGRHEAFLSGEKLVSIKIDKIISSDLLRAKETTEIINRFLSRSITFDTRLREINFGDLQGMLSNHISDETWNIFNHHPDEFHAESLANLYKRVKSFFDELDECQNTLIVTHGGVIRMTIYYAANRNNFNQAEFEKHFLDIRIKNTEIFSWDKSKGSSIFNTINSI